MSFSADEVSISRLNDHRPEPNCHTVTQFATLYLTDSLPVADTRRVCENLKVIVTHWYIGQRVAVVGGWGMRKRGRRCKERLSRSRFSDHTSCTTQPTPTIYHQPSAMKRCALES